MMFCFLICCFYFYCSSFSIGEIVYYINKKRNVPATLPINCPKSIKTKTYVTLKGNTYYVNEAFKLVPVIKTGEAVLSPLGGIPQTAITAECFNSFGPLTTGCTFPPKNGDLIQTGYKQRYRLVNNANQKLGVDQCNFNSAGAASCTGGYTGWFAGSEQCITDIENGLYDAT